MLTGPILSVLLAGSPPTPAPDSPVRSVSSGYIGVTLRVLDATVGGNPVIGVVISTSEPARHSVGCINVEKILKFRLLDASGKTMPSDGNALAFAPVTGGGGVPGYVVHGHFVPATPVPCANVPNVGEVRARLREAYPDAPKGTYVLYVTLHMPGMKVQRFAPITVRLNAPDLR